MNQAQKLRQIAEVAKKEGNEKVNQIKNALYRHFEELSKNNATVCRDPLRHMDAAIVLDYEERESLWKMLENDGFIVTRGSHNEQYIKVKW